MTVEEGESVTVEEGESIVVTEEEPEPEFTYPYENNMSFKQSGDLDFPVVSEVTADSATTITLTGTNFLDSADYDAFVEIADIGAHVVEITGDTVTASWNRGIPPITEGAVTLWFQSKKAAEETVAAEEEESNEETAAESDESSSETATASSESPVEEETPAEETEATEDASAVEEPSNDGGRRLESVTDHKTLFYADTSSIVFDNTLEIASVADVSCSFAGGCQYEVTGVGVSTLMANGAAHIRMCDEECIY